MTEAADFIQADGTYRRLGTIPQQGLLRTSFPAYASAGPMFTRTELESLAKISDTQGRTKFDQSWILDQKGAGSCNGHAAASALSKARVRRGSARVMLSGPYAYSLMNGGQDNGSTLDAGMKIVAEHGIAPMDVVPNWDMIYPNRYDRRKADEEALRFRGFECYTIKTEPEFFSALAAGFDVVIAVHAGNSFMRMNSNNVAGSDRGPGNHATHCDGYRVLGGQLQADMPNSWGLSYGALGRCFVTWDEHLAPTVNYHGFYAIRSAIDDPHGDNPPAIGEAD